MSIDQAQAIITTITGVALDHPDRLKIADELATTLALAVTVIRAETL